MSWAALWQCTTTFTFKSQYKRRCTDLTDLGLLEKSDQRSQLLTREGREGGKKDMCYQGNTAFELNMAVTVIECLCVGMSCTNMRLCTQQWAWWEKWLKTNNALWVCAWRALGTYSTLLFCVWACLLSSECILYPCTAQWDRLLSCFVCSCWLCVCRCVYVTPSLSESIHLLFYPSDAKQQRNTAKFQL